MVRNYWYAIALSSEISKTPAGVRRFGSDLVLWRDSNGQIVCFPDRCPHRGAPLSKGKLLQNGCLQCPFHGFQFDHAGQCRLIPANGAGQTISPVFNVERIPVREQDGFVWQWWGEGEPVSEIPRFENLPDASTPAYTITLDWDVPFRLVMASMFDMHHFPFLHKKVSHGLGSLLDPYHVEMVNDRIITWGNLRPDNGKSVEASPGFPFRVTVHFPAMMFMGLTKKLNLLVQAAPVDENRTWLALRYYQTYVRLPILGALIARLSAELERKLVHPDDERQLKTLRPPLPGGSENQFIKADKGVAVWLRRYHQELETQSRPQRTASGVETEEPVAVYAQAK
jgi:phenylpropionate dioxygenase-like ring-hydroxylating dioxygenase large terminal subunit